MDRVYSDVGIKRRCGVCRNLLISEFRVLCDSYVSNGPHQGFALFHVFLAKEELTIEV